MSNNKDDPALTDAIAHLRQHAAHIRAEGRSIDYILSQDFAGLARLLWRAFSSLPRPFARRRWGPGSRALNAA